MRSSTALLTWHRKDTAHTFVEKGVQCLLRSLHNAAADPCTLVMTWELQARARPQSAVLASHATLPRIQNLTEKHPIASCLLTRLFARARQAKFMDAVIKVFCVHTEPNYSLPWQRKRQYASTSSGFMVSGPEGERWLLTNAHSVEYSSQVLMVQELGFRDQPRALAAHQRTQRGGQLTGVNNLGF